MPRTSKASEPVNGPRPEHDVAGPSRPPKRVQPIVSCLECRRMKWKCDRVFPCYNCRKRDLAEICPGGHLNGLRGDRQRLFELQQRNRTLEAKVAALEAQLFGSPSAQSARHGGSTTAVAKDLGTIRSAEVAPDEWVHEEEDSAYEDHGQLTVGDEPGSSKFFGSAGAAFLMGDVDVEQDEEGEMKQLANSFPFSFQGNKDTLEQIRAQLPDRESASALADIYFRDGSIINDIIQHATFSQILAEVYSPRLNTARRASSRSDNQKLAVLLLVLAIGSQMDLSLPPYNETGETYARLGQAALALDPSSSVTFVRALLLLSRYQANGRNAVKTYDQFWCLLGFGVRSAQHIGLHRDGERWGLSTEEVQLRRKLFWEVYTEDALQSLTQGRPRIIMDPSMDIDFPDLPPVRTESPPNISACFHHHKYRVVKWLNRINDLQNRVKPTPYREILEIDSGLREAQRDLPDSLRTLTSMYKDDLQRLAIKLYVTEGLMFLHRKHFAKSLRDCPDEPMRSPFRQSYVTELEASQVAILILRDALASHRSLVCRYWFFLFHGFAAIVNFAAVVVHSPKSLLAASAFRLVNLGVDLFENINVGYRARDDLPKLRQLLRRAQQAMAMSSLNLPIEGHQEDDFLLGVGTTLRRVQARPVRADVIPGNSDEAMESTDYLNTETLADFLNFSRAASEEPPALSFATSPTVLHSGLDHEGHLVNEGIDFNLDSFFADLGSPLDDVQM